jgi:hypothetical protein
MRALQQFPLDAFEEYQLHKAIIWAEGTALYRAAGAELWPEAYPPLYFYALGIWQWCFGQSFVAQRSLSLIALAGMVGCGLWALNDVTPRALGRLAFVTALLSFDWLSAKFFEVGKPDTLFTFLLATAITTGRHRNKGEILASSLGLWLASLTKQSAPIFLAPLVAWHFMSGRRQWAILWGASMVSIIAVTYLVLNWQSAGNFSRWVFVWTAGHGIDVTVGLWSTVRAITIRAPLVLVILIGSLIFRPRCLWTWFLVAALGVAVMGMSKAGGRENHLMPLAFLAALVAARAFAGSWATKRWRCAVVGAALVTIVAGSPTRSDLRWLAKRSQEARDWVAAVRQLDGSVAVSHHLLLARRAGAECFFSDLILEFRGLDVPDSVERRIAEQQFDYLVLCDDPSTSATRNWSHLIEQHYVSSGLLQFPNVSQLLPNRLFQARRRVSGEW